MPPKQWTDQLWRAVFTLLACAIAFRCSVQIITPLLPVILAVIGLVLLIRLALSRWRDRSGW